MLRSSRSSDQRLHAWLDYSCGTRWIDGRGEKGIAILAPCLYRGSDTEASPDATERTADVRHAVRELLGFRVVHVFDVSQADGKPLPDVVPEQLVGAAPAWLWDRSPGWSRKTGSP